MLLFNLDAYIYEAEKAVRDGLLAACVTSDHMLAKLIDRWWGRGKDVPL